MTEVVTMQGRVTLHEQGLSIDASLGFNEWRELVRQLLGTNDRALWSLGDAWVYGQERFGKDYDAALRELAAESRLMLVGARVARGFPASRRRDQLSFEVHSIVASEDPDEQDRWLDEAERQGWGREQLAFEFVQSIAKVPVPALSLRATGELHSMLVAEAERRDVEPKALAPIALERGLRTLAAESLQEVA